MGNWMVVVGGQPINFRMMTVEMKQKKKTFSKKAFASTTAKNKFKDPLSRGKHNYMIRSLHWKSDPAAKFRRHEQLRPLTGCCYRRPMNAIMSFDLHFHDRIIHFLRTIEAHLYAYSQYSPSSAIDRCVVCMHTAQLHIHTDFCDAIHTSHRLFFLFSFHFRHRNKSITVIRLVQYNNIEIKSA